MPDRSVVRRSDPHISYETYLYLVAEVRRLEHELRLANAAADEWYLRATYTDEERAEMYRRASFGLDENGQWLWPDGVKTNQHGSTTAP